MALTLPPIIRSNLHAASRSSSVGCSSSSSKCFSPITSSLSNNDYRNTKAAHHRCSRTTTTTTTTTTSSSSPLQAAEDLAARFGLEMAVAGLERLFREASQPPDLPDPNHPGRRPVRVAYQGVRGSYCQEAATAAFPSSSCYHLSLVPCAQMEDAFAALEDRSVDRAVIPIENSLDGPIPRNLDLLLRHPEVRIAGELLLPVDHCLLALPAVSSSMLRRVVSHPQALAHCRDRLRGLSLEVEEAESAAGAAQFVAENRMEDTAVIGSKAAAQEFGLRIVERNFQDHSQVNRFLKLALASAPAAADEVNAGKGTPRMSKTTVAFSLAKGPSDLFRAMWIFESRGVRVTRFDHRPNRSSPVRIVNAHACLDYNFVLEVDGLESDHAVRSALARLHEFAGSVRVLGSYKCTCA